MVPPPVYNLTETWSQYGLRQMFPKMDIVINGVLPNLIAELASQLNVQVINHFDVMGGMPLSRPELILDNVHPTDLGYQIMADTKY